MGDFKFIRSSVIFVYSKKTDTWIVHLKNIEKQNK